MAEKKVGYTGLTDSSTKSILNQESENQNENSASPAPVFRQDLRSVLATSVLNVEMLDVNLYRGTHHWVPRTQRLFGGQIIGQALVAAAKSVSDNLYVHSLHCYFVRAGDPKVPVLYHVERTRDGHSFTVRFVKAVQHGQPILICQASFQKLEPSPLQHQFTMPVVPKPEELLTIEELIHLYLSKPGLAENLKQALTKLLAIDVPIEIKPVNPPQFYNVATEEAKKLYWVRAKGYIGEGNMKLHCCVAAYVSDFTFLATAILPYPNYRVKFSASLDHAMWFHNTFRSDEWMLYECESPWAGGSRGLVQGRLWRRDGVLAASCSQEGVLRVKVVPEPSKL
ncbi:acyl-coenzyme A thioesterase 8 [Corythoichthys intestinalis]|uniref:acyl-coenzyme A thioesterase 8 n=1 Tax=Corythoichthys intestinalis TaxID=161448 RepID=UPI0025A55980|nr:acyl-coenzyme A thioesterase 8 [Corythoichthys intestinalis]XP_061813478.1 acyl-coenzyme A thioesterase 8-like [Nerophis lumbriciformis]